VRCLDGAHWLKRLLLHVHPDKHPDERLAHHTLTLRVLAAYEAVRADPAIRA
jgi:hypothetical protein